MSNIVSMELSMSINLDISPVVVAALIAGLTGILGFIFGREQKTAEFRQAWVDQLRAECAELVARIYLRDGSYAVGYPGQAEAKAQATVAFWIAEAKVRLRLSRNRKSYRSTIDYLDQIGELVRNGNYDLSCFSDLILRFTECCQSIVNEEWIKIKGTYKMLFLYTLISIIAICFFVIVFVDIKSDLQSIFS